MRKTHPRALVVSATLMLAGCSGALDDKGQGGASDASSTHQSASAAGNGAPSSTSSATTVSTGTGTTPPPNCVAYAPATGPMPALQEGNSKDISPPGLHRPRGSVPSYGCMDIHVLPCSPSTLYVTTDSEGMWKSTDGGSTWNEIGNLPAPISPGVIQIDPLNPLHMYYGGGVRGASLGFWVSNDGGDNWAQPDGFTALANNSVGGWVNDVYVVTADPNDFNHVLLTFHSPWELKSDAGVLETMDGGNSWVRHLPIAGWGAGHAIWFLADSHSWLLGTQGDGYWRTADSGTTWTQVSTDDMIHGGSAVYRSSSGALYVGANHHILRSTDDAVTLTPVGPETSDGFYAVTGDGQTLYAQLGNTGANSGGTDQPYVTSPESDGTTWTTYNDQVFSDGPYRMTFDPVNRIVYSANWNEGVLALKPKNP